MLRNILITGARVAIIDPGTKRQLSTLYNVMICDNTKEDIRKCMKTNKIHLAIICVGQDLSENILSYRYLKSYQEIKLPIFIMGTKEHCEELKDTPGIKDIEGIFPRPINIKKLISTIDAITLQGNNAKKEYGGTKSKMPAKTVMGRSYKNSSSGSVEFVDEDIEKELNEIDIEELEEEIEKKKILVVDDDVKMLKLISIYLEEKYDVAIAKSGESALRYLKKNIPDMILLDYMMPNEDGGDVLIRIREYERCKKIPVLFLTGVADAETVRRLISLQPQGYILKPVTKDALYEKINSIWEREEKSEPVKTKRISDGVPDFIKERIVPKTVDIVIENEKEQE